MCLLCLTFKSVFCVLPGWKTNVVTHQKVTPVVSYNKPEWSFKWSTKALWDRKHESHLLVVFRRRKAALIQLTVWFLPHHGGGGSGVVLWLGGGTGRQCDITSSLLPIKRLILGDDSLLHAVLKHRHEQLDEKQEGLMNLNQCLDITTEDHTVCFTVCTW